MFIVRFQRLDGKPNEDYYYRKIEDAEDHFRLFLSDDSCLYFKISLLSETGSVLESFTPIKNGSA